MNHLVNDLVNVHLKGFVNIHLSDLVNVHMNGHDDAKARSIRCPIIFTTLAFHSRQENGLFCEFSATKKAFYVVWNLSSG